MKDFYELKCYAIQVEDKLNNKNVLLSEYPHIVVDKYIEWHEYKLKATELSIMGFDCDPSELTFNDGVLRYPDQHKPQIKKMAITNNDAKVLFDAWLSFVEANVRISDKVLLERCTA